MKKKKVKVRKYWGSLNPVTRVIPNKKKKNYKGNKGNVRKEFNNEV